MRNGTITDFENLRSWFMESPDCVRWSYKHGFNTKSRNYASEQKEENISIEESWDLLSQSLQRWQGGPFTIFKPKTSQSHGYTAFFQLNGMGNSSINGVVNHGNVTGIFGQSLTDYIAEQVKTKVQLERNEDLIKDLIAQQEAKVSVSDQIITGIFEKLDPNLVVDRLGAVITGLMAPRPSGVVHGTQHPDNTSPTPPNPPAENLSDEQRLEIAFSMMVEGLGEDIDLVAALLDLGAYAQKNGDLFRNLYLSQIKGSYEPSSGDTNPN